MPVDPTDVHQPASAGRAPAPIHQRLAVLFAAALLLFNFPLLALWDHPLLVFGLPLFPLALFVIWALLIAVLAWLLERHAESA